MIRTTVFSVVLLLSSLPAMAQEMASGTPDAEYLQITHAYTLHADGSTEYEYSHQLRLLTSYAFSRAYGESFIVYDPEWQKLEVLRSETTMSGGRKVSSPFNAYNEVLPGFAAGLAPFLGLREMVVTHTGLESGSVVDFAYRLSTKSGFMPGLSASVPLAYRSPAQQQTVKVRVPAGATLHYQVIRSAVQPARSTDGEYDVYEWTFGPTPLIPVEEGQNAFSGIIPALHFSNYEFPGISAHVLAGGQQFDLPLEIQRDAHKLLDAAESPLQGAAALQRMLRENIATMHGNLSSVGFRCRPAAETWSASAGSELDAAIVLTALCRAAGLEADPVLFSTDVKVSGMNMTSDNENKLKHTVMPRVTPDFASLQLYDRPAVLCYGLGNGGAPVMLDPASGQNGPWPTAFAGRIYIPLTTGDVRPSLYLAGSTPTRRSISVELQLGADGMLTGSCTASVDNTDSYMFSPASFGGVVSGCLSGMNAGVAAASPEYSAPDFSVTAYRATVKTEKPVSAQHGLVRLHLPAVPRGIESQSFAIGMPLRTTEVLTNGPCEESCSLLLKIPEGTRPVRVPEPVVLSNDAGSVKSVFRSTEGSITVERSLKLNSATIAPEAYADFRELMQVWMNPAHREVMLMQAAE